MKRIQYLSFLMVIAMIFSVSSGFSQEKYYNLTTVKEIKTNTTKDLKRVGTCWSNAGASFLEAEMLRLGKEPINLAPLQFVHSAYLKKAEVYLNKNQKLRVDPSGTAYDVIALTREYGMAPESEFMYPEAEMTSAQKQGEMDAIIRGTLNMIKQKNEGFSERWQNVYNTSLLRYLGEPKIEFQYNGATYTPNSFADASGLNLDDYLLLTSVPGAGLNAKVDPDLRQNWADNDFYNVTGAGLFEAIKSSIEGGYTVIWYGHIKNGQLFVEENMAIVPAGDLPGENEDEEENTEPEYKPLEEKQITPEMHADLMEQAAQKDQAYLLIYAMTTDQEDNTYFTANYACKSGDQLLNLSRPFVELNTVYLMVNKNGLPSAMQSNLGL